MKEHRQSEELGRLDGLSPQELQSAFAAYLDGVTEEDYDPEMLDAYLDALDGTCPLEGPVEVEGARGRFREKLRKIHLAEATAPGAVAESDVGNASTDNRTHTPGKGGLLSRLRRGVVCAMVALGVLSGTALTAQAFGVDVFGRLAQWSDEQFWFMPSNGSSINYAAEFRTAVENQELPASLAPTRYPEGFEAGEAQIWEDEASTDIDIHFVDQEDETRYFSVWASLNYDENYFSSRRFMKDERPVEPYTSGGRTFYIIHNLDFLSAVWSDEREMVMLTIDGTITVDEIKSIIDSIPPLEQEGGS